MSDNSLCDVHNGVKRIVRDRYNTCVYMNIDRNFEVTVFLPFLVWPDRLEKSISKNGRITGTSIKIGKRPLIFRDFLPKIPLPRIEY